MLVCKLKKSKSEGRCLAHMEEKPEQDKLAAVSEHMTESGNLEA